MEIEINRKFEFTATKTYATEATADLAVAHACFQDIRHFIVRAPDGRFYPVFVGQEAAQRGVHFRFNVVS
jgi:hypothetical protein